VIALTPEAANEHAKRAANAGASFPTNSATTEFCCPLCKGGLDGDREIYRCNTCDRSYPVIFGIADFRVFNDPYISIEADREKGLRLAEQFDRRDFRGLMEYYWELTPDVPRVHVDRYVHRAMNDVRRGEFLLDRLFGETNRNPIRGAFLELGCQSAGMLAAAAPRFERAMGVDIAFRWLVMGKKRLEELGLRCELVCCCAEHLPFADQSFDVVLADSVLEHVRDQARCLRQARSVLKPSGRFEALTCNRYSLGPEPHVRLWGVGFLPRRWMDGYVHGRRGIRYQHIRLLSRREVRRLMKRAELKDVRIVVPAFSPVETESLARGGRALLRIYEVIKDWPMVSTFLTWFGPVLQASGVR